MSEIVVGVKLEKTKYTPKNQEFSLSGFACPHCQGKGGMDSGFRIKQIKQLNKAMKKRIRAPTKFACP